jgi:hypothetical protein
VYSVYDRFRHVMHEGDVDKRVQYTIEALFLVRKTGFETAGFPAVPPELDLVEPEDQITHEVGASVQNSGFEEPSPCMFTHLRLRWCCLLATALVVLWSRRSVHACLRG